MTVRTAELVMSIVLIALSIALMVKSAELNIGWVPRKGPGAGAWPFWLSAGLLAASVLTLIRWVLRITPESRSDERFLTPVGGKVVGLTVAALVGLLAGTHLIGMYLSVFLFLFFFLRIMGRHGWFATLVLMVAVPTGIFVFFEWALKVPLPKGVSEPLFYPIYDLIY